MKWVALSPLKTQAIIDSIKVNMGLIHEYIERRLGAKELEVELLSLISKYNKLRGSFLLVYSASLCKPNPKLAISMEDYYIIYDLLKNAKSKKLDVYIETPGGSGEAAEEIVRFFRSKFEQVDFVVSGEAKSAGTIMTLSADNILMTKSGSLGPIDAQMKIGRSQISGYDYIEWVKEKRTEAEKNEKLNPFDANMVAQISPGELNGVENALSFAKDLVIEWLPKYKFRDWKTTETRKLSVTKEMKEERAKEIVEHLINHTKWRSHGRSIKIDDLKKLLKIVKIDDEPELSDVVYRIQTVLWMLYNSSSAYKVFATETEKIIASAVPLNNIQLPDKLPIQPKQAENVQLDFRCQKCGKAHKLYAKLVDSDKIDVEMAGLGFAPFPKDNKLKCDCGFESDLTGIKNDIETQTGKKIVEK